MAGYRVRMLSEDEAKEIRYDSFEAIVNLDAYLKCINEETDKSNLVLLIELLKPWVYLYSQLIILEEE